MRGDGNANYSYSIPPGNSTETTTASGINGKSITRSVGATSGGAGNPAAPFNSVQINNSGVFGPAAGLVPIGNGLAFKGPIPYRDITAYMPTGACDNTSTSTSQ